MTFRACAQFADQVKLFKMDAIRVLIVDDEALVRHALRIFVEADPRTTLVGEAHDGLTALGIMQSANPDVILMDIQMPGTNGVEATEEIVSKYPGTIVLALTTFSSERHVVSMLRAGAAGYLVKDTEPQAMIQAIVDVHSGRSALSPQISRALVSAVQNPENRQLVKGQGLTKRELSIVRLLAKGMSNLEIGDELNLAETTVKANFGRIMAKWHVRDRVQVLIYATRIGAISLAEIFDETKPST